MREREIWRYLGFRGTVPDERTQELVRECAAEVAQVASPRHALRRFPLHRLSADTLEAGGLVLKSGSLAANLRDCTEVSFFAATLGSEVDRRLNRYLKLQISKAAVFQATAAEAIEYYCNTVQEQLRREAEAQGFRLRPRFSPGYGELSLTLQPDFLRMVDAAKRLGIVLSEGGIMLPEKSVTALIGWCPADKATGEAECAMHDCAWCTLETCLYRI